MENIIRKLKINDNIDETMLQKLHIENDDEHEEYVFKLDEWAVFTKILFKENLRMKFLKLWSILRLPITNTKTGSCEWRIRGTDNDIYIIKSLEKDNTKSLLERENWIITANTNNKNKILKFLKHFGEAIDCYNTYYTGVETGDFTSSNTIIQNALNSMKNELVTNWDLLNMKF